MPLYEFRCDTCQRKFEALIRLGQEGAVRCEACGGPVRKLFSTFGVGGGGNRLKSSGSGCTSCSSHSCSTCK